GASLAGRPVDAARDTDRPERPQHDRGENAAAVDGERAVRRTLDEGRGNAGGGRPAAVLEPAERGIVPASLEVMGLADTFLRSVRHERLQADRGPPTQVFLVRAGACHAEAIPVEDRDDPVFGQALALDYRSE